MKRLRDCGDRKQKQEEETVNIERERKKGMKTERKYETEGMGNK